MKILRRIIFLLALVLVGLCTALLVTNYDPTNPTHRRYSSEPVITETDDVNLKGESGENVLSKDLGIPINDRAEPRKAFCNSKFKDKPPPRIDIECIYYSKSINDHRIPDFLSEEIIADSKNRRIWSKDDIDQITIFAEVSIDWGRPLWIYVRHNTVVDPIYHEIVEKTGGRIIYYFQTEQPYVDPVDFALLMGIVGGLSIIVIWTGISGIITFLTPSSAKPKSSVAIYPHKSSQKAKQRFDDYDDFMRNASDNARKTLDE